MLKYIGNYFSLLNTCHLDSQGGLDKWTFLLLNESEFSRVFIIEEKV